MPHLKPYQLDQIMRLYNSARARGLGKMQAYKEVGETLELNHQTVQAAVIRLSPTTTVAQDLIKARAFRMAARLIRKANPSEIIEVLSRPNIGVLAPKVEEGAGRSGFFLSVTSDSCGAVNVKAASISGQGWAPELPAKPIECNDYTLDAPSTKEGREAAFLSIEEGQDQGQDAVTEPPITKERREAPRLSIEEERAAFRRSTQECNDYTGVEIEAKPAPNYSKIREKGPKVGGFGDNAIYREAVEKAKQRIAEAKRRKDEREAKIIAKFNPIS